MTLDECMRQIGYLSLSDITSLNGMDNIGTIIEDYGETVYDETKTEAYDEGFKDGEDEAYNRGFEDGSDNAKDTVMDWYEPDPPERY